VYADECGANTYLQREYARALRREKAEDIIKEESSLGE
jgi:hypothetical protein